MANPNLTAEIDGIDSEETRSDMLRFSEFTLDMKAQGNVADAELTVTIVNPSENELEAQLAFHLPKGAAVTGYAIDLEDPDEAAKGLLIDGVLLEEKKARTAYENQVRGEVDPGLAQVSRAGIFTTSIYPVNEDGGTRRMRLKFSFAIGPDFNWPIMLAQKADKWAINLELNGLKKPPVASLPNGIQFKRSGIDGYTAQISGANSVIEGAIRLSELHPSDVLISRHKSGDEIVHLSGPLPKAGVKAQRPELVRVYWDKSLSRNQGNVPMERKLAVDAISALNPAGIEFIAFDADAVEISGQADSAALGNELDAVRYSGGSGLGALAKNQPEAEAEICLMFYDGLATVDRKAEFDPNCRLHIFSSVPAANTARLSAMARQYGGQFHAIASNGDLAAVIAKLTSGRPILQAIRGERGKALPFITLPAPDGYWAAVIKSQRDTKLDVRLAAGGKRFRRQIPLDASAESYDGAGALWAKSELALRDDGIDRKAFLEFARRYSVEYPGLSFLVLEDPDDYVRNDIAPPGSYPKEMLSDFREARKDADEEIREEREERFANLLKDWEELKEWWAEEYDEEDWKFASKKRRNNPENDTDGYALEDAADAAAEGAPLPPSPPPPPPAGVIQSSIVAEDIAAAEQEPAFPGGGRGGYYGDDHDVVIVTGTRIDPKIDVKIDAWQPDRPYLKALDAAGDDYAAAFLIEEKKHGSLPAFYLDVSRWHAENGRDLQAQQTLLSALELPVANDETMLIVAQRLLRFGQHDRAIDLLDYLAARQQFLPQPKRHLALALLKRARMAESRNAKDDYERAIALLYDIAVNPVRDGDEGIDLVSLVEANAALSAAKSTGAKIEMDERLVASLDTDVRVVIDWTTESTDLDLWVIEPTGEKAYYSNRSTSIGGHMSDDMTDGYGPEEYMIRRAMPGDYQVRAHVYSSDRINPNGVSILTARLIRNFGRPGESEEYVDIELGKPLPRDPDADPEQDNDDEEEDKKVGVITVAKPE
ncbi:VIT domain-containing protein [Sphingorhabdus arenilitoris]|uniref:VIT domain-containing protein n=1 Tax=Sphingorhabdus arenilitoris TaxID=1490041 RepID=A0ABV8RKA2_9SPHN